MAFPIIESQSPAANNINGGAATNGGTAATSHAVVMPATVSPGSLLLAVGRVAVAGTVAVTGGGWTIVQDSSDASDDVSFWMYRTAAGTEDGTSITVTHGSGKMVAHVFSITGAEDPTVQVPETSTVAVGTGSNPGPTAATPTGGAKDYLWLAIGLADGEHTSPPTTIPSGYGGSRGSTSGTAGVPATNVTAFVASLGLNAASEDPGTWATSIAVNSGWTAWTIAIPPLTPPGVTQAVYTALKATAAAQLGPTWTITPDGVPAVSVMWSASIAPVANVTIAAAPADGTGALLIPAVSAVNTVTIPPAAGVGAVRAPTLGTTSVPTPLPAAGVGSFLAPTAGGATIVAAFRAQAGGSLPPPTPSVATTSLPASGTGGFRLVAVAALNNGVTQAVYTGTKVLAEPQAGPTWTLTPDGANAVSISWSGSMSIVSGGKNVTALPAAATGSARAPSMGGDTAVVVPVRANVGTLAVPSVSIVVLNNGVGHAVYTGARSTAGAQLGPTWTLTPGGGESGGTPAVSISWSSSIATITGGTTVSAVRAAGVGTLAIPAIPATIDNGVTQAVYTAGSGAPTTQLGPRWTITPDGSPALSIGWSAVLSALTPSTLTAPAMKGVGTFPSAPNIVSLNIHVGAITGTGDITIPVVTALDLVPVSKTVVPVPAAGVGLLARPVFQNSELVRPSATLSIGSITPPTLQAAVSGEALAVAATATGAMRAAAFTKSETIAVPAPAAGIGSMSPIALGSDLLLSLTAAVGTGGARAPSVSLGQTVFVTIVAVPGAMLVPAQHSQTNVTSTSGLGSVPRPTPAVSTDHVSRAATGQFSAPTYHAVSDNAAGSASGTGYWPAPQLSADSNLEVTVASSGRFLAPRPIIRYLIVHTSDHAFNVVHVKASPL